MERFTNSSKTKLNMVYNTLKIFLGSNHLLTITMATMMHPFQKARMDNNSMKVFFVLKNIKTSDTLKSKMILTCYFVDKSVERGPKMDLIIAPLEVYIGKMLIFIDNA